MASELDGLWQEAIARPDDDGVRGVLADTLQAAGDPRGELMSLQLLPADPEAAPARRARIRELVTKYGPTWAGPLYELARAVRFDRGFITRVELASTPSWSDEDSRWRLEDREYATIQEVLVGEASPRTYHRIVTSPTLISLRGMQVGAGTLAGFEETPARITHVACTLDPRGGERAMFVDRLLHACAAREDVRSLVIGTSAFEWLLRQPWLERLTRLGVAGSVRRVLPLWKLLPAHTALVVYSYIGLDTCDAAFPSDLQLELGRDGVARIAGEWLLQSLEVLAELPREITRIEIEDTSELIEDRIRRHAEPRGLEVRVIGKDGRAGNVRWKQRR